MSQFVNNKLSRSNHINILASFILGKSLQIFFSFGNVIYINDSVITYTSMEFQLIQLLAC